MPGEKVTSGKVMASMCRRVSVLSKAATGLSNRQIFSVTRPNQLYTNVQHIDGVKFSTTSQNCLKESKMLYYRSHCCYVYSVNVESHSH